MALLLSPRPDSAGFIFRVVVTWVHMGSMPASVTLPSVLSPVIVGHSNGVQELSLNHNRVHASQPEQ